MVLNYLDRYYGFLAPDRRRDLRDLQIALIARHVLPAIESVSAAGYSQCGSRGIRTLYDNCGLGRQVQFSFLSGPAPFAAGDQQPAKQWEHSGWNPIQADGDFTHASRVQEHRKDGHSICVTALPWQWPSSNVPRDCTFEPRN